MPAAATVPASRRSPRPAPARDIIPPKPDDPAIIFFTSGSTGKPKGVCHSFETLGWIVASAVESFDMGPDDVMMPAGSASHVGGHHLSLMTFAAGGRVVTARTFDGDEILPLLREERPTKMWMLPSALYALVRDHGARRADFASVKACFSGGDKVSDALEKEFTELAGIAIDEDYGMTEMGIPTVTPPAGAEDRLDRPDRGRATRRRSATATAARCRPARTGGSGSGSPATWSVTGTIPRRPPRRSSTAGSTPAT